MHLIPGARYAAPSPLQGEVSVRVEGGSIVAAWEHTSRPPIVLGVAPAAFVGCLFDVAWGEVPEGQTEVARARNAAYVDLAAELLLRLWRR